ncbi:sacsin N-terminal ATP-binding-like domain-containing protein [Nonomuraea recticatena]|uniref:sacsin N-terminal ATP-binding-like domain-containing protein n=1 Tax=Nonomuraea recticatena TaxID=46178 RepID=UPI003610769B
MDTFGTDRMRAAVLTAWKASPARFREDANAEEDFALGGYRDRLIVELAQNAADAALRAGVPGVLRLELRDGVLTAANTGAPLDAAGVEGLSTLRVSAKRDHVGAAGRFGVGFAAVVSVCDAPSVGSRSTGAVRWSREETTAVVAAEPVLAGELANREGHVPLLRLPFPDSFEVPEGFETLVRLPLRPPPSRPCATCCRRPRPRCCSACPR